MLGVRFGPHPNRKRGIKESKLIESIYLDTAAHSQRASRYTRLIEQLAAAEAAKQMHDAMAIRVATLHLRRIEEVRQALEAEGARLRALIKVART